VDLGERENADLWWTVNATSGPEPPAYVLELYKLSVEMADRTSARRATANSYFLTLQTGLAGGLGLFSTRVSSSGSVVVSDPFVLSLAAAAGILLAGSWWLLLRSYRDLNRAKFAVINEIEDAYFDVKPFRREWQSLKGDPVKRFRGRYAELGAIEKTIPVAFAVLYIVLAASVWLR